MMRAARISAFFASSTPCTHSLRWVTVGEGKLVEEGLRLDMLSECRGEVYRHRDLARLVARLDIDVDLIAGADPCCSAVLSAEWHEELTTHRSHRRPMGVGTDRDPDNWPQLSLQGRVNGTGWSTRRILDRGRQQGGARVRPLPELRRRWPAWSW